MDGGLFEWDPTVFGDPLSITISGPDHAADEDRFVIVGTSASKRLLVVVHTMRANQIRLISARSAMKYENEPTKKQVSRLRSDEMRKEYDFLGGVRGKYVGRYREGNNVVLLDPEIAAAFPIQEQ